MQEGSNGSSFRAPCKAIFGPEDVRKFQASGTYAELLKFIRICNEAVRSRSISTAVELAFSRPLEKVMDLLRQLEAWVQDFPPLQQPMRFGNRAFKNWHARLRDRCPDMVGALLPEPVSGAVVELVPYLLDSFGNTTRIDYGTGHELNFVTWLYCLSRLGLFGPEDAAALVLRVFNQYMQLMRHLQHTYLLEPAGSHGVWGLDDYHCLPFLWGSAMLINHPKILPSSIDRDSEREPLERDFMYLACIGEIKRLKSGAPFAETSPMLHSISRLSSWQQVNSGMLRLLEAEVLGKFPVIQHHLFGSIVPATWTPSQASCISRPPLPPHFGLQTVRPGATMTTSADSTLTPPTAPALSEFQVSTPAASTYDGGGDTISMSAMTDELLDQQLPRQEGTYLSGCDHLLAQAQVPVQRMNDPNEQVGHPIPRGMGANGSTNTDSLAAEFSGSFVALQGLESF